MSAFMKDPSVYAMIEYVGSLSLGAKEAGDVSGLAKGGVGDPSEGGKEGE